MLKVNLKIEQLLIEKQQNDSIIDRLKYLEDKLKKLSIKEKAYELRTEEELADVRRLEELGLKSLFRKVMGDLDETLDKERKEYLSAVLKHKAVEEEIDELVYEQGLLKKRYREPALFEKELSDLIKKKKFQLRAHDSKFTKELFKRESELGRYKLLHQKAKKVLQKAEIAIKIVSDIKVNLLAVKDWPPSGKGKYASVAKKRYIDKARAKAIQAKVRLDEFGEMTNKLFHEIKLDFELRSFDYFLDTFYNNLITDYVIQKALGATLVQVEKILKDVKETAGILLSENEKYATLSQEKEKSIEDFIRDYKTKTST